MNEPTDDRHLRNVLEAALLAAGRPLTLAELVQLFPEHERPETKALRVTLEALGADYDGRGIELKETASGFRIQVRSEFADSISRLWPERPQRYSRALLETLALIAYRQPITRAEIEAVRGVAVNPNILKTLMERSWVRVVGHRDVPGRPELLATTREFLDYFGLKRLEDLPPLAELRALADPNLQLPLPGTTALETGAVGDDGQPPQAAIAVGLADEAVLEESAESAEEAAAEAAEAHELAEAAERGEADERDAASRDDEPQGMVAAPWSPAD